MSTTVTEVRTAVLARIRDVDGIAHDDVFLDVLSDCQRLVNACYGGVMADVSLTLIPGQTSYTYESFVTDIVRPISVTFNGRVLHRTSWTEFKSNNSHWLHSEGIPRVWDALGHHILFVVPSPALSGTATVRYIVELPDLTLSSFLAVPDQHVAAVSDLVTEVLLLRQRLFPSILEAAQSFTRHSNPRIVV